MNLDLFISLLS